MSTSNNSDPAERGAAVVPSDTVQLPAASRGLYVGTGGDVTLVTVQGDTLTFKNLSDGYIIPVAAKLVTTATTATDIISLW